MRVALLPERSWCVLGVVLFFSFSSMNLRWNHPLSILAQLDEMIIKCTSVHFL